MQDILIAVLGGKLKPRSGDATLRFVRQARNKLIERGESADVSAQFVVLRRSG